ncbi:MAG: cytochrome c [Armatimonadetes bacterium]|nr:cytochrome c [Armatimonadota bacterium]
MFVGCGQQSPPASTSPTPAAAPPGATTAAAPPGAAAKADAPVSAEFIASLPGAAKWKGKKNPVPDTPENLAKGKELFLKNCATCHGDTGTGDGPAGAALDPKPRNFSTESFKFGGEDWQLMRTIMDGAPQPSGMVGWDGRLDEKDAWTLINYVKALKAGKT